MIRRTGSGESIYGFLLSVVVAAVGMFMSASCERGDTRGDMRSEDLKARLAALDDSMSSNSAHTLSMIKAGLGGAKDSLEYYDFYIRYLRYGLMFTDTGNDSATWRRAVDYLYAQKPTPRVNGMMASLMNNRAFFYHKFHNEPHKTVRLYQRAYRCMLESDGKERLPDICANLADAYVSLNDLKSGAQWYRRALYLSDSLGLPKSGRADLYVGLGRVYVDLENFTQAQRCYELADENYNHLPLNMKMYFLNNYGNYYYYKKDYRHALETFEKLEALLLQNNLSESYEMYLCMINMADTYLNLGLKDEAYEHLLPAEEYFKRVEDGTAIYYANTIHIGLALMDNDVAAVKRILDHETPDIVIDFNLKNIRDRYMWEYYVKKGDYKKAYETRTENFRFNDSLKHNRERVRISDVIARYTQDTLKLHHQLELSEKTSSINKMWNVYYFIVFLAFVLLLLILYLIATNRKRRLQLEMQLIQLKLLNLRDRISPHFIFNVLNSRISSTGKKDADELLELSKLIRANLKMSGKLYVSLKEELDFVKHYISVERTCMDEKLDFVVTAPSEEVQKTIIVPSMFIHILVENSLKHGLKGLDGDKILRLVVKEGEHSYRISVIDNGTGFDIRHSDPDSTKVGLNVIRNVADIINRINKRKIRLEIRNLKDADGKVAGCEATLFIPKNLKDIETEGSV